MHILMISNRRIDVMDNYTSYATKKKQWQFKERSEKVYYSLLLVQFFTISLNIFIRQRG